jgi:hypothetical protein
MWFIENSVQLQLVVKFLKATSSFLKKFEIRLIATFHDQDLDMLINVLSENKVLEFVEIDGIHLTNNDIHLIQLNK